MVVGKIVEMDKQEGTPLTKCVVDCGDYGTTIASAPVRQYEAGRLCARSLWMAPPAGGIKIRARKMQGVESTVMLCSGEELG